MKRVLSLFNGMGCGSIALKEIGIDNQYYYSEIDKHAKNVQVLNFKNSIPLGDITNWKEWDIDWNFDLVMAGSPCQGFSFAGKQLNFSDERSKLFFVFVDILNHIKKFNPDVKFLLENVNMKKEYLRIISECLGVFPININSAKLSAQNRERWYWSNIKTKDVGLFYELWTDIPQPEDKGILLKDILQPESEVDEKYYLSDTALKRMLNKQYSSPKIEPDKTGTLNTKNNSGQCSFDSVTTLIKGINLNGKAPTQRCSTGRCLDEKHNYQIISVLNDNGNLVEKSDKSNCIDANYHKGMDNHAQRSMVCVAMRGRNPDNTSDIRTGSPTEQRLEPRSDMKTNTITTVQKDNLIFTTNYLQIKGNGFDSDNRFWKEDGKHAACVTRGADKTGVLIQKGHGNKELFRLRRLTSLECQRLQTVPEWFNWGNTSDSQKYKMLGNGWTVEVIKYILCFWND